jgi:hypothetical protein
MKVIDTKDNGLVLFGVFCGYAEGPVTDIACQTLCDRYDGCDEACHNGDLSVLLEGQGNTWCDVCGELILDSDGTPMTVTNGDVDYTLCSCTCAQKVMKPK